MEDPHQPARFLVAQADLIAEALSRLFIARPHLPAECREFIAYLAAELQKLQLQSRDTYGPRSCPEHRLCCSRFSARPLLWKTPRILMVSLDGERRVVPLVRTPFSEMSAEVSPDGRWLAYQWNESGQDEVYVRPFPNVDAGRWQVSTGGGTRPVWSRNGRELFSRKRLVRSFAFRPRLFSAPTLNSYRVTAEMTSRRCACA